jgi:hypothetical protein
VADIENKRGDTFEWLMSFPEVDYPDGYFVGWEVTAQIRTENGRLIGNLAATWADPAEDTRILRLFASASETSSWAVGEHELDVQLVRDSDGTTKSTATKIVEIIRDVTQP